MKTVISAAQEMRGIYSLSTFRQPTWCMGACGAALLYMSGGMKSKGMITYDKNTSINSYISLVVEMPPLSDIKVIALCRFPWQIFKVAYVLPKLVYLSQQMLLTKITRVKIFRTEASVDLMKKKVEQRQLLHQCKTPDVLQ